MERREEIFKELATLQKSDGLLFSSLLVTDITELNSIFFISGKVDVIKEISYPKIHENIFSMKGILSRKKQLIPYLTDVIGKSE